MPFARPFANGRRVMIKPLTVVLAALIFALTSCAGDPPKQTSGANYTAPADSGGDTPWMVPIRFLE